MKRKENELERQNISDYVKTITAEAKEVNLEIVSMTIEMGTDGRESWSVSLFPIEAKGG